MGAELRPTLSSPTCPPPHRMSPPCAYPSLCPEPWAVLSDGRCSCRCPPARHVSCVLWRVSTQDWTAEHPSLSPLEQHSSLPLCPLPPGHPSNSGTLSHPGPAAVHPPRSPSFLACVPRSCGFLTLRVRAALAASVSLGDLRLLCVFLAENQGSVSSQSVGPAGAETLGRGVPSSCPISCVPLTLGGNPGSGEMVEEGRVCRRAWRRSSRSPRAPVFALTTPGVRLGLLGHQFPFPVDSPGRGLRWAVLTADSRVTGAPPHVLRSVWLSAMGIPWFPW